MSRVSPEITNWTALLPKFWLHENEPFCPISINHLLRHSVLQKWWEGKRVTMPGSPDRQCLTIEMIRNEHQSSPVWKELHSSRLYARDMTALSKYVFASEAPVYVIIKHQSDWNLWLRCMYLFSGKQEKHCWKWSLPQGLEVQVFDLVYRHVNFQWYLVRLSWNTRDDVSQVLWERSDDTSNKNTPIPIQLQLSRKDHYPTLIKAENADNIRNANRWDPIAQRVKPTKAIWCKVSNFSTFLDV